MTFNKRVRVRRSDFIKLDRSFSVRSAETPGQAF